MGKNTTGGNKQKKQKNNTDTSAQKIVYRNEKNAEYYAQIEKALGNCRFSVKLIDDNGKDFVNNGELYTATLPGKFRIRKSKNFMSAKDFILVQKRQDAIDNKVVDVLFKYNVNHVRHLMKTNAIPDCENEGDFVFGEEDEVPVKNNTGDEKSGLVFENEDDDSDHNKSNDAWETFIDDI